MSVPLFAVSALFLSCPSLCPPDRIVEHRLGAGTSCPNCGTLFGESVHAAAIDFNVRQMIPYARCAELFTELFSCPVSQGTLANFVKRAGAKATVAMEPVREQQMWLSRDGRERRSRPRHR